MLRQCLEPGYADLSEYGFSLKDLWRNIRSTRDQYIDKVKDIGQGTSQWIEDKKVKTTDALNASRDLVAIRWYLRELRVINNSYKRSISEKDSRVRQACSGVQEDKRSKCEKKVSENWINKCNQAALRQARTSSLDAQKLVGTELMRIVLGMVAFADNFPEYLRVLKARIREDFPKYQEYAEDLE